MNDTERIAGLDAEITVELGRTRMTIDALLNLKKGTIITCGAADRGGEGYDVRLNGNPFAAGEVVTVGETFGVRLTRFVDTD